MKKITLILALIMLFATVLPYCNHSNGCTTDQEHRDKVKKVPRY